MSNAYKTCNSLFICRCVPNYFCIFLVNFPQLFLVIIYFFPVAFRNTHKKITFPLTSNCRHIRQEIFCLPKNVSDSVCIFAVNFPPLFFIITYFSLKYYVTQKCVSFDIECTRDCRNSSNQLPENVSDSNSIFSVNFPPLFFIVAFFSLKHYVTQQSISFIVKCMKG